MEDCQPHVALVVEDCQPHVSLVVEDFHCLHALAELPFDPLETWLLPQTEMLCVLRYHVSNQGEVTMQEGRQEHEEHHPSSDVLKQPTMHRPTSA